MPEEGNVIGIEAKPGWQLPPARFSEGKLLAFFTAHHVMTRRRRRRHAFVCTSGRGGGTRRAGPRIAASRLGPWPMGLGPHPYHHTPGTPSILLPGPALHAAGSAGTGYLGRARGVQAVAPQAPLRSRGTCGWTVCHGQRAGDGDAPTSPLQDTRLLAVALHAFVRRRILWQGLRASFL